MQRLEKSFSSLAACYAFLASLAALLLIYARLELQANPPDWGNLIGGLIHGSGAIRSERVAQVLDGARSALFALRDRMHSTWLFLAVFGAVWLGCLFWMQIERHRRGVAFSRREAYWIVGFTLLVFTVAVLYGLGTNGILARRLTGIVPISDLVAVGFVLALPLFAWSRLGRSEDEQEEAELELDGPAPDRSGFLGLSDDAANARLVENLSRVEVKPVELIPAVQVFHGEPPSEQAKASATRLMETAGAPAAAQAPESAPVPITTATEPSVAPVSVAGATPSARGIEGFSHCLAAMNHSWQRIEAIRGQIDEWFEVRRREAITHLDTHPGMRPSAPEKTIFQNFPSDKLAAVDAEWAEIRKAALEMNRWFQEAPGPDQRK